MHQLFRKATLWIVDRPWLTLLLLIVISGGALLGHMNPKLVTDLFEDPPTETVETEEPEIDQADVPDVERYSLETQAILVVESDQFFTARGVEAMRHIVSSLEEEPFISDASWMDTVPIMNMFGLPVPLFPHASASQAAFDNSRKRAMEHPFIVGQMLSPDGETLTVNVNFDFLFVESDEQCISGLREAAEKAAKDFPEVPMEFSVTGSIPIYATMLESHDSNNFYFQLIGYSVIALMALILFRGFSAVFIVSLAPALGVFWTVGYIQFFDVGGNPFNEVVLPILVSLVGLTDGVHLMVQIRKLRASGMSPVAAAKEGIGQVGLACALTSLTTAIGFGSLMLANHHYVQDFGFCCVIGVLLTFISVVTVIPLACSTWLGKFIHVGHDKSLIDKNLGKISEIIDFVLPRRKAVSILAILSTIALVLISTTLRPDERQSSQLPTRSEPAIALKKLDRAMGGLEMGGVRITWNSKIDSASPEVMEVVTKVDGLLLKEELIGRPISIRAMVDSLPGDGPATDRMSMLELLPPPLKRVFYGPEKRYCDVLFRVRDLGIAQYDPVFQRIQSGLTEIEASHPEFNAMLNGEAVWRWENLYQIVVDLAFSLGSAVLIIFIVLSLVYRSLRIGLISFVPNLFPLAVAGTFLVVTGQSLEVVVVCAFTVCLGIAVDDTIHFLTRYQEEKEKCANDAEAIRNAFTGVGTALIMTTIVLVAGFSTVMFSDSRDHFIFASMGMITISAALFADLIFLPALLAWLAEPETNDDKPVRQS